MLGGGAVTVGVTLAARVSTPPMDVSMDQEAVTNGFLLAGAVAMLFGVAIIALAPEASDDPEAATPPPTTPSSSIHELTDLARTRASEANCAEVLRIGAHVRELDLAYYENTFATDREISACVEGAR